MWTKKNREMIINENDQKKPTITTTVSYGLVVIISGLLLFSEAVSQFDDGFDMSYYEFALIVVFLQALMGAARFGKQAATKLTDFPLK